MLGHAREKLLEKDKTITAIRERGFSGFSFPAETADPADFAVRCLMTDQRPHRSEPRWGMLGEAAGKGQTITAIRERRIQRVQFPR